MAIRGLRGGLETAELKTPVVHLPVADNFREIVAENILSQHADHNGRIGRGKCACRPLNELREIKKKRCFDFILRMLLLRQTIEYQAGNRKKHQRETPELGAWAAGTKKRAAGFRGKIRIYTTRITKRGQFCLLVRNTVVMTSDLGIEVKFSSELNLSNPSFTACSRTIAGHNFATIWQSSCWLDVRMGCWSTPQYAPTSTHA